MEKITENAELEEYVLGKVMGLGWIEIRVDAIPTLHQYVATFFQMILYRDMFCLWYRDMMFSIDTSWCLNIVLLIYVKMQYFWIILMRLKIVL